MTIKQQGGIFGRNPTYNDVEANNLDVNASLSVSGQSSLIGDVAIGLSSPSSLMHVYNTSPLNHIKIDGPVVNRSLNFSTSNSNRWNIYASGAAETGSNAGSDLVIARYTDAGGYLGPALAITRSNANITTYGNIIMANGKGIDFSATADGSGTTTTTSELFDDYEEGVHGTTITPTTSGTISMPSTNNQLAYTKIGNIVHVSGYLYVSAVSSPVGAFDISLPFTAADLQDKGGDCPGTVWMTNINAGANLADFQAAVVEGSSVLTVTLADSISQQGDSAQQVKAGTQIKISVTYKAA